MDRKPQFENGKQRNGKLPDPQKSRNLKNNIGDKGPNRGRPDLSSNKPIAGKQVMGFEEFLRKKETKTNLKEAPGKLQNQRLKRSKTNVEEKREMSYENAIEKKQKKVEGILRERSPKIAIETLEKPDEHSLENIFAPQSMIDEANHFQSQEHTGEDRGEDFRMDNKLPSHQPQDYSKQFVSQIANADKINNRSTLGPDETANNKNIRGLLKKEIYGDDEYRKKEAQMRMKKELEYQMEQNKIKKDLEKKRKEEEEKREQERYEKYLEKEKEKILEEERKEQELKFKKDQINMQNMARLEEAKRTSLMEKKNKFSQKAQNGSLEQNLDSMPEQFAKNNTSEIPRPKGAPFSNNQPNPYDQRIQNYNPPNQQLVGKDHYSHLSGVSQTNLALLQPDIGSIGNRAGREGSEL